MKTRAHNQNEIFCHSKMSNLKMLTKKIAGLYYRIGVMRYDVLPEITRKFVVSSNKNIIRYFIEPIHSTVNSNSRAYI